MDYENMFDENGNYLYDEEGNYIGPKKEEETIVKDCNGNILKSGDKVAAIEDRKVKGGGKIKRGETFKIKLIEGEEDKVDAGNYILETKFFKKI